MSKKRTKAKVQKNEKNKVGEDVLKENDAIISEENADNSLSENEVSSEDIQDNAQESVAEISESENDSTEQNLEPIEQEFIDDFDSEDPGNDDVPETEKETEEKSASKKALWKKTGIISGIVAGSVALVYLAGVAYYSNHYFFGTHIGNFKCSNMSIARAEEHLKNRIKDYKFTIYAKDGSAEVITGEELQLQLIALGDLEGYKKAQNPFMWPFTKQVDKNIPDEIEITINEEILAQRVNNLKCVSESIASLQGVVSNIYFDETDKVYKIMDDGTRNIVSLNMMQEKVKGGILGLYPDMNLEADGCYVGLAGDDTISGYLGTLNTYMATTVDYVRGEEHIILDGGTIHTWIKTGDDYTITLDYDAIKKFISDLAGIYNTRGKTRTIVSSATGANVNVYGGDYGWLVDEEAELTQLCAELPTGQAISREPSYKYTAGSHGPNHDFPGTYVEISINHQKLWLYKDGVLILTSNVVTGNPYMNNATHTGTYSLKYKMRDTVLIGADYRSPVHFWMPFNGGEGLHDAPWRYAFGGTIYRGGGSHGCVNLPYATAKTIYDNVQAGIPVVIY